MRPLFLIPILIWFALLFLLIVYLAVALAFLAVILFAAVALGFKWQGHKPRKFWMATAPKAAALTLDTTKQQTIRIEGREFSPGNMPSRLEFTLECRNLHMIMAILFISCCALAMILSGTIPLFEAMEPEGTRYGLLYLLCYLFAFLAIPAWVWVIECWILRRPAVTLANVHPKRGRLLAYDFKDPGGGYHGGTCLNFGGPENDHLKIVLCLAPNLDVNRVSSGLLFHRIGWAEPRS